MNETPETPHRWFELAAELGENDTAVLPRHIQGIKAAFRACVTGPFSPRIDDFTFILRVDGKIKNWELPPICNPELSKRSKYIAIDVHVPESAWKQGDDVLARYLSRMLPKALVDIIFYLGAANIPVDAEASKQALVTAMEYYRQHLRTEA